jgi:predicted AAA+ superfamily ATPase
MLHVSNAEIRKRMSFDNPWWGEAGRIDIAITRMPKRTYFLPFCQLVTDRSINRAVILMGPRRVGKTIMLCQCIDRILKKGMSAKHVIYVPLDAPVYNGLALERCLELALEGDVSNRTPRLLYFFSMRFST